MASLTAWAPGFRLGGHFCLALGQTLGKELVPLTSRLLGVGSRLYLWLPKGLRTRNSPVKALNTILLDPPMLLAVRQKICNYFDLS